MAGHSSRNRRQFLGQIAASSAGLLAAPYFVRATALGAEGKAPASDRLVMGCIGVGGKGRNNMGTFQQFPDVQVVAVCDPDANHCQAAKRQVDAKYGNQDCQAYVDYRELTARKDIDVLSVATPDHWHAITTIAGLNQAKDVYCEKPLANSIGEGRAICAAAKRNQKIVQCGSHERSTNSIRFACEQIRNGALGKIKIVRVNLPTDDGHHKKVLAQKEKPAEQPVPTGLDFDLWLGHTPKIPYRPWMADQADQRCHFWWRFILAYGGGEMTDRGAHVIDLAHLALDRDNTGPTEIEARGVRASGSVFDSFFEYTFTNTYADGLQLVGSSNGPRGLKFEGENGWIFIHVHGGRLEASDPKLIDEKLIKDKQVDLGRSPGHHRNFIDCVKSRKDPFATAEIGHRTASLCHLNNIAMILGRKLKWDPQAERFLNDDEANALVTPKMRAPWSLSS